MLQISTPLAVESAKRSREFREKIEAAHRYKVMKGIDPSPYWAEMWMWELITLPPKKPQSTPLARIIKTVCEESGITRIELGSACRLGHLVRARQIIFYLARKMTRLSLPQIGAAIGGRDHTTVLHGYRKIEAMIAAGDEELIAEIGHFTAVLK